MFPHQSIQILSHIVHLLKKDIRSRIEYLSKLELQGPERAEEQAQEDPRRKVVHQVGWEINELRRSQKHLMEALFWLSQRLRLLVCFDPMLLIYHLLCFVVHRFPCILTPAMCSLQHTLQAYSNQYNNHTCPACGKSSFKTTQGVLRHLSQAESCKWYKKGKLKDLGIEVEEVEQPAPIFTHYTAAWPEQPPEDVIDQFNHELFNLIPSHPPLHQLFQCNQTSTGTLLGPLKCNWMMWKLHSLKFIPVLEQFSGQVSHCTNAGGGNLRVMWKWQNQDEPGQWTQSTRPLLLQ